MFARTSLLSASLLALFISACSQAPADVAAPTLEPQFGTPGYDLATEVAADPAHPYVYAAGNLYDERKVFLRRYNADGGLAWQRLSPAFVGTAYVQDVGTDAAGNAVVVYAGDTYADPLEEVYERVLVKYDKGGRELWRKALSANSDGSLTVDRRGNIYVATVERGSRVEKYAPDGRLLWDGPYNPEFSIRDLAVSDTGELFVSGNDFSTFDDATNTGYIRYAFQKYSPDGKLRFDKTVAQQPPTTDGLVYSGGAVYLAYGDDYTRGLPIYLRKYDGTGNLLARRTVPADATVFRGLRAVSADGQGNVYLTGYVGHPEPTDADPANYQDDLFVSKFTAALRPAWTYNPERRGTNEVGFGVAARNSGEVYAVGRSNGKVGGVNKGGIDAFLVRLNGQGQRVWER